MATNLRIIDMQRRATEVGRVRLGAKADGGRPTSLEKFRFTSTSSAFVEWIAATYGGTVAQWDSPAGSAYEVFTDTNELDIAIPSWSDPLSQSYELWSGGGCQRRCNGAMEFLSGDPCLCNPDKRECKPVTRFSFIMPGCPVLGVVRLETGGMIAAQTLPAMVDAVELARGKGVNVRATLRLEKKTSGAKHFVVPVLEVAATLEALESGRFESAGSIESGVVEEPEHEEPAKLVEAEFIEEAEVIEDDGETITLAQVRRLFAVARENHGEDGESLLRSMIGDRATKEVLVSEYDEIIKKLEAK